MNKFRLSWDAAEEVAVTLADGASTVAAGSTSDAVKVDGGTVTISAAGTYRLSGSLSDGRVVIAAGEEDDVRIILDGVELSSSTGSPLVVQSANEAIVYLEEGSTNTIEDAASYAAQGTDAPNAALYSLADLTIAGTGALTVNGRYNDGIISKDGLVLAAGNVSVDAADDGIWGKDYTVLLDGAYSVTAGGDGVKADWAAVKPSATIPWPSAAAMSPSTPRATAWTPTATPPSAAAPSSSTDQAMTATARWM